MSVKDIERRFDRYPIIVQSDQTDESTRSDLNLFAEQHRTIDLTKQKTESEIRDLVGKGLRRYDDPMVVVHRADEMGSDMQEFLSTYLKSFAEGHPDVPILVYDSAGNSLSQKNPDLQGRVYEL